MQRASSDAANEETHRRGRAFSEQLGSSGGDLEMFRRFQEALAVRSRREPSPHPSRELSRAFASCREAAARLRVRQSHPHPRPIARLRAVIPRVVLASNRTEPIRWPVIRDPYYDLGRSRSWSEHVSTRSAELNSHLSIPGFSQRDGVDFSSMDAFGAALKRKGIDPSGGDVQEMARRYLMSAS